MFGTSGPTLAHFEKEVKLTRVTEKYSSNVTFFIVAGFIFPLK
jgi:hypothetical protein